MNEQTNERTNEQPNLHLKQLKPHDGEGVYALLQQMPEENGFMNDAFGMPLALFPAWLTQRDAESRGENLMPSYVPQTIFWCYDGETPVGYVKLRHYLNASLREVGGHIGYGIAPAYRGKGYATRMLRLVLREAKARGIAEALVTITASNAASRRVAEKCGGVLREQKNNQCYYLIRT